MRTIMDLHFTDNFCDAVKKHVIWGGVINVTKSGCSLDLTCTCYQNRN